MKQTEEWGYIVTRPETDDRQTLDAIPFEALGGTTDWKEYKVAKEWSADNKIKTKLHWLLPQLYSLVGNFSLPMNEEYKIDGKRFWSENLDMTEKKNIGIQRFFQIHPRGTIVPDQNKPKGRLYSRLVPLVLSAVKEIQGVQYSEWDRETLHHVVDSDLCSAMLVESIDYTREELLAIRDAGMTVKSGASIGSKRNTATCPSVWRTGNIEFDTMPDLWQVMMLQIWVAHPVNRLPCMVLDAQDWDNIPEPLITDEIIPVPKQKARAKKVAVADNSLPWDEITAPKPKAKKVEVDLPWYM